MSKQPFLHKNERITNAFASIASGGGRSNLVQQVSKAWKAQQEFIGKWFLSFRKYFLIYI